MALFKGLITVWYEEQGTIPANWQICDGTNDTPDMRDCYPFGASDDTEVGDTGGALTHTHTNASLSTFSGHTHTMSGTSGTPTGSSTTTTTLTTAPTFSDSNSNHTHSWSITTNSKDSHSHTVGTSNSASSQPPYKRYYLIMYLGA